MDASIRLYQIEVRLAELDEQIKNAMPEEVDLLNLERTSLLREHSYVNMRKREQDKKFFRDIQVLRNRIKKAKDGEG